MNGNSIIQPTSSGLFDYEVLGLENTIALSKLWKERLNSIRQFVMERTVIIADIIESTRPTRLPMVWSMYPERLWDPEYCCKPTVTIPTAAISSHYWDVVYGERDKPLLIETSKTTIYVECLPPWNAYSRWSSVIIDDFYRAMRAVRNEFGVEWDDRSKARVTRSWEKVTLRYFSKDPLWITTMSLPKPVVSQYGTKHYEITDKISIAFSMEIPESPDGKNMPGCHIVEEVETRVVTEKVRRMKCE